MVNGDHQESIQRFQQWLEGTPPEVYGLTERDPLLEADAFEVFVLVCNIETPDNVISVWALAIYLEAIEENNPVTPDTQALIHTSEDQARDLLEDCPAVGDEPTPQQVLMMRWALNQAQRRFAAALVLIAAYSESL